MKDDIWRGSGRMVPRIDLTDPKVCPFDAGFWLLGGSAPVHNRSRWERQQHSQGENMIMALIDFEVAPEGRAGLLEALQPLLAEARGFEGNRGYRAWTDSESSAHIGLLHEWDTIEHFRTYAASDLVDRVGKILRPAMTTPPVSRRLRTEGIEEVRG